MSTDFVRVSTGDTGHIALVLQQYQAKLKEDLETKYNGHPNWCAEDEEFLNGELVWCQKMIRHLLEGRNAFDR